MCIGKDLFLNRRTRQAGYIEINKGKKLSQTQLTDLTHVVYYVKCKYNFLAEDIAEFFDMPEWLVVKCLNEPNKSCLECNKKFKKSRKTFHQRGEVIIC